VGLLLGLTADRGGPFVADPAKPHHGPDGRFCNPNNPARHAFSEFLRWQAGGGPRDERLVIPRGFTFPNPRERAHNAGPTAVWINHSTFLVSAGGVNVLTDPIFSERCSPVPWAGPRRRHPPGIAIEDLPPIHHVFVSHSHYDHLDLDTARAIGNRATWWVPLRLGAWFREQTITNVVELDWWDTREVRARKGQGLLVTSVPVQHFSGRTLLDRNTTLWTGWMVRIGQRQFYFAGDTGYNPHDFRVARERLGPVDLALIPIGAYSPRWFMKPVHVNPEEAVQIHEDLGARLSIGMHWKTFRLTAEPMKEPPYALYLAMEKRRIPFDRFRVIDPGQRINW
jgi:N-acyl-phosphatidylethanolamine-hydrolysing phospholipase D